MVWFWEVVLPIQRSSFAWFFIKQFFFTCSTVYGLLMWIAQNIYNFSKISSNCMVSYTCSTNFSYMMYISFSSKALFSVDWTCKVSSSRSSVSSRLDWGGIWRYTRSARVLNSEVRHGSTPNALLQCSLIGRINSFQT